VDAASPSWYEETIYFCLLDSHKSTLMSVALALGRRFGFGYEHQSALELNRLHTQLPEYTNRNNQTTRILVHIPDLLCPVYLSTPSTSSQALPSTHCGNLELSRSVIHNPNILNNILQALHKSQVCWVFFQIVSPILFIREMGDEAVRETALQCENLLALHLSRTLSIIGPRGTGWVLLGVPQGSYLCHLSSLGCMASLLQDGCNSVVMLACVYRPTHIA
jgi:hypothetical protein